ncbi:hypothetical protein BKA69DRAFT_1127425 [Paraphysoderma sedebokerense]|nr:hypothetical protein BKA69DRAFT_1127425 [Paraphysoderma sedebokerense]
MLKDKRSNLILIICLLILQLAPRAISSRFQPVTITSEPVDSSKPLPFDAFKSDLPCPAGVLCKSSSKAIAKAALSSATWKLNEPVTLFVQTSNFNDDEVFYLVVELYRLEPRSLTNPIQLPAALLNMPKYQYEGAVIRKYDKLLPNMYYRVTFTPPSFLKSGNYLVVVSHHKKEFSVDYESIHLSVQATVSFERSQLLDTKSFWSRLRFKPAGVRGQTTPTIGSLDDVTSSDVIQLLFNSIDSVTELCSLCSSSRNLQGICDRLLSESVFPPDLQYPTHTDILITAPVNGDDASKLSTRSVCRLARIDVLLQKLEFKLLSIAGAQNSEYDTIPNIRSHLVSDHKELPRHLSIWTYPNLYYQIGTDLANRFNLVKISFDFFFFKIKYKPVPKITETISLEELEKKVQYLTDLPKSIGFKSQITSEILAQCFGYYVWAILFFPFSCSNLKAEYNRNKDLVGTADEMVIKPARNAISGLLEVWAW